MALEYDLASALRPRLAVDLGAGDGSGFLGYCQAACDRQFELRCYAADEWKSRRAPGGPGFNEVRDFVRRHYMGQVTLVEAPPDELRPHFLSASVDLLRFDGTLPFDAAAVTEWLDRVSAHGVVVVEGVETDAGRALWQGASHGRVGFELHGLGVAVPAPAPDATGLLALAGSPGEHASLARFYEHVGFFHQMRRETDPSRKSAAQ